MSFHRALHLAAIIACLTAIEAGQAETASSSGARQEGRSITRSPLPHPDILFLPNNDGEVGTPGVALEDPTGDAPVETGSETSTVAEAAGAGEADQVIGQRRSGGQGSALDDQRVIGGRSNGGSFGLFSQAWPLLVVLTLILIMALVVKRFLPGRRLFTGSGAMEIVARTTVSAKQQLMLVKLGRRLVLLGVSPDRMTTLALVDDPEQVALLLGEIRSSHPESMSQAFDQSFQAEAEAYRPESDVAADDATVNAYGQVRGLLKKVRHLSTTRTVV